MTASISSHLIHFIHLIRSKVKAYEGKYFSYCMFVFTAVDGRYTAEIRKIRSSSDSLYNVNKHKKNADACIDVRWMLCTCRCIHVCLSILIR